MTVQTYQPIHHFTFFGRKLERPAYVICQWWNEHRKAYVVSKFLPEQLQIVPSLSDMSFRELKSFEPEAAARWINK